MTSNIQLVSPSDIAQLAKRSRAAVSNWRSNPNLNFPEPSGGTTARPLFKLDEIKAWLLERQGITIEQDASERVWGTLNSLRGKMDVEQMRSLTFALLCLRKLSILEDKSEEFSCAAHADISIVFSELQLLATSLDESGRFGFIEAVETSSISSEHLSALAKIVAPMDSAELKQVANDLLDRTIKASGRSAGQHGYVNSLPSKLLTIAALRHKESSQMKVYDPASGYAEILLQVAHGRKDAMLFGAEISESAHLVAIQRALLSDAKIDMKLGDVLSNDPHPHLKADVVVAEPPLGLRWNDDIVSPLDGRWSFGLPSKSSADLLWIQDALAHLSDNGVAYILTHTGALSRSGPEQKVRQNIVSAGCVRTVVALPPKLLTNSAVQYALWVLQSPQENAARVNLIDASNPELFSTQNIVDKLAGILDGNDGDVAQVSIKDILTDNANLSPTHWTAYQPRSADEVTKLVDKTYKGLVKRFEKLQSCNSLEPGTSGSASQAPHLVRIAELKQVVKVIRPLSFNMKNGKKPELAGAENGDVVLSGPSPLRAFVATEAIQNLKHSDIILRIQDNNQLDPFFLASMIAGQWNERHMQSGNLLRFNVEELQIPVFPLEDQRRIGGQFHRFQLLQAAAEELSAYVRDNVIPAVQEAVIAGVRYYP